MAVRSGKLYYCNTDRNLPVSLFSCRFVLHKLAMSILWADDTNTGRGWTDHHHFVWCPCAFWKYRCVAKFWYGLWNVDGMDCGMYTPCCDLECTTELSQRQTTGFVELFLLACYILITHVYECILLCMYNDVCSAECGLQQWDKVDTYLLTYYKLKSSFLVWCVLRMFFVGRRVVVSSTGVCVDWSLRIE